MPDLKQVLEAHQLWLETDGKDGAQADLRGADLRKENFETAHLEHALLRDANLSDANLASTTGLLGGQLAGTNVSGARLPDAISKFDAFGVVQDGSKHFMTLVISMLAAVAYVLLTIGSTRDGALLANSGTTQLPIIATQTPIVQFFWLGPLLLTWFYVYYLLNAQRVCELLAEMPAVFPDGRALDKKLNSLLLSALVRLHFRQLKSHLPPLSGLQRQLSILAVWWVVPLTLLLFWARYLRRHDWPGTLFQVAVVTASVGAGLMFYRLVTHTLEGLPVPRFQPIPPLVVGVLLLTISFGAIEGVPSDSHGQEIHALAGHDPRRWLPHLYEWLELSPNADLQGAELSQKPPGWTDGPGAVHQIKGAHLRHGQLKHARASGAFFVNADLRGAQLEGAWLGAADLRQADLRGADLSYVEAERERLDEADLEGAILTDANMAHAQMTGTDLKRAKLTSIDLQSAQLSGARLAQADLTNADLLFADLRGADFAEANLEGAHLEGADLTRATGLQQAQLDKAHTNQDTQVTPPLTVQPGPTVLPSPRWRKK